MRVRVSSPGQPNIIINEESPKGRVVLVIANSGWESDGFYEFVSESVREGIEPETWWVQADTIAKDKQLHISFAHLLFGEEGIDCALMGSIRLIDNSGGFEISGHFDERVRGAITRALGVGTGEPKLVRVEHCEILEIRFGSWSKEHEEVSLTEVE